MTTSPNKNDSIRDTASLIYSSVKDELPQDSSQPSASPPNDENKSFSVPNLSRKKLLLVSTVGVAILGFGAYSIFSGSSTPAPQPAPTTASISLSAPVVPVEPVPVTAPVLPALTPSTNLSDASAGLQMTSTSALPSLTPPTEVPTLSAATLSTASQQQITDLEESVADLKDEVASAKREVNELRRLTTQQASINLNAETRDEELSATIASTQAALDSIRAEAQLKVVKQQKEAKKAVRVLSEDSVEIYGRVYYVGGVFEVKNKKYLIMSIRDGVGIYVQDSNQKQFLLRDTRA